jgi:hypothetical protein
MVDSTDAGESPAVGGYLPNGTPLFRKGNGKATRSFSHSGIFTNFTCPATPLHRRSIVLAHASMRAALSPGNPVLLTRRGSSDSAGAINYSLRWLCCRHPCMISVNPVIAPFPVRVRWQVPAGCLDIGRPGRTTPKFCRQSPSFNWYFSQSGVGRVVPGNNRCKSPTPVSVGVASDSGLASASSTSRGIDLAQRVTKDLQDGIQFR